MNFTVAAPIGGPVVLISPSGTIGTISPTFKWNALPGVTQYSLRVDDSAQTYRVNTSYKEAAACSGNTCSATPGWLHPGKCTWWVWGVDTSYNSMSQPMTFTVIPDEILGTWNLSFGYSVNVTWNVDHYTGKLVTLNDGLKNACYKVGQEMWNLNWGSPGTYYGLSWAMTCRDSGGFIDFLNVWIKDGAMTGSLASHYSFTGSK